MGTISVLEATAQIVSSAVGQRSDSIDAGYGKEVADFAEAIYRRLSSLEFDPDEE